MALVRLSVLVALLLFALAGCSPKQPPTNNPSNKPPAPGQTGALTAGAPPGGMHGPPGPGTMTTGGTPPSTLPGAPSTLPGAPGTVPR